jgi:hypothetical protein
MKPVPATLKIHLRDVGVSVLTKLGGQLLTTEVPEAEFKFDTPVEIGGTMVDKVHLEAKYGRVLGAGMDAQTVFAFWNGGPDQVRKALGEGILQCDSIALSQMDFRRNFYARSVIVAVWTAILSSALYGGFRYQIVHGTIGDNLPVLTYVFSFFLSLLFLISLSEWRGPGGFKRLGKLATDSTRMLLMLLMLFLLCTFFLFAIPAMGFVKTFNAWLDVAPPVTISGPVVQLGPLLTVRFFSRTNNTTIQYCIVAVENANDGKTYWIDIPKALFDQEAIHVGSRWTDVIHQGALIPYRIGAVRPDQTRS